MKFKAKIDAVYMLIYILNLLVGAGCAFMLYCIDINFMVIILAVILGIEIVIVSFMIFNCYYIIEENAIKLVIGFISITVKIRDITEIRLSKNMVLSFALARQRIELKLGNSDTMKFNKIYVSPKDRDGFILLLNQRCKYKSEKGGSNES